MNKLAEAKDYVKSPVGDEINWASVAREQAKNFDPSNNEDVLKLQKYLNYAGLGGEDGLSEDGVLGRNTLTALRGLQGVPMEDAPTERKGRKKAEPINYEGETSIYDDPHGVSEEPPMAISPESISASMRGETGVSGPGPDYGQESAPSPLMPSGSSPSSWSEWLFGPKGTKHNPLTYPDKQRMRNQTGAARDSLFSQSSDGLWRKK